MNSPAQLLERLLKLLPAKILKAQFDVPGSTQAEKIPQIVAGFSEQAILDFLIDNLGHTKQHTYIFKLSSKFDRASFAKDALPMRVIGEFHGDDNYAFECLPIVEYQVALLNPYEEFAVHFYQPTRIVIQGRVLVIQTTIMERSASAYLPVDKTRRLIDIDRSNTEEVFIQAILTEFRKHYTVERMVTSDAPRAATAFSPSSGSTTPLRFATLIKA